MVHIYLENYSGKLVRQELIDELTLAGIDVKELPDGILMPHTEVKTSVFGVLYGWEFKRDWRYWRASGPGIPLKYAMELNKKYGNTVRVNGYAGGQSPLVNHGLGINHYHIDTTNGLKALADTIKKIVDDNKRRKKKA